MAAGAQILEKHYKISEDMECIDAPVSISQTKMKQLVENVRELETIMGNPSVTLRKAEKGPLSPLDDFLKHLFYN